MLMERMIRDTVAGVRGAVDRLRAGPGALAADVQDVRAVRQQPARMLNGDVVKRETHPAGWQDERDTRGCAIRVHESSVDAARRADGFGALPPRGQHAGWVAAERARRC